MQGWLGHKLASPLQLVIFRAIVLNSASASPRRQHMLRNIEPWNTIISEDLTGKIILGVYNRRFSLVEFLNRTLPVSWPRREVSRNR